jgi:diacylglycerol kinase
MEIVRPGSKPSFSALAAWLGTALVGVRAVPLVLHSAAHVQLGIFLPSVLANGYIIAVLFLAPVIAAILLWTSAARVGAWLLLGSMLGSLLFELYNHYMAMSPDNVTQVPHDGWGRVFEATAAATIVLEAAGCLIALYLLIGPLRAAGLARSLDGDRDS